VPRAEKVVEREAGGDECEFGHGRVGHAVHHTPQI
jgi:hypothetical protein